MSQRDRTQGKPSGHGETDVASPDALIGLLSDEFTRAILARIRGEHRPARELAEECGMSRPTVYRRLERLEEAGLVETENRRFSDGYHRRTFQATLDQVAIGLGEDGFSADVSRQSSTATAPDDSVDRRRAEPSPLSR